MIKINKSFIKEVLTIRNKLDDFNKILEQKIKNILSDIVAPYGAKIDHFELDCDWDDRPSNIANYLKEEFISNFEYGFDDNKYDSKIHNSDALIIIDKNNKRIDLGYYIPTRWLYENYTLELNEGRQKYINSKNNKKKNKIKNAQIKKNLKEKLSDKLTKEELKLLKLT